MRNFIVSFHRCCCCSVWFFYTYLYCRHLWNFNSHFVVVSLSVAFTLPLSHAALSHCRRSLGRPLSFSLSLTSHRYDMLSYTYTCCCLSHARECYLFTTHSVRRQALSLSRLLLFTLSAFAYILNCFATCGKSTSRLVAHFAFDSTVAISALSSPTPNICICLHLCVCVIVHILMLFCVGVLRLSLVVCSTCDSRFIFLSIAAASTRRQPPTARRASLLRSRLASFDPHSFLVICSGSRKKTREKLIRI